MTMGEVLASSLNDDDLMFMEERRQLKELSSPATTSTESSRQTFSDEYDDIITELETSPQKSRTSEDEEQSSQDPSPSPIFDTWDMLDGMDLPVSVVEKSQKQKTVEIKQVQNVDNGEKEEPEDCHDFYGEIKWCDEILQKFEAQLASEENEIEKSLTETQEEAKKLVAETRLEKEREKLVKKNAKQEEKLKRRALSQANKEKPLFCCFICNKGFLSEENVQRHVNEAHLRLDTKFPFKCKHCTMRYAHMPNLYRHMNTHQGQAFKCPQCPYQFKLQASLDIHIARDHKDTDEDMEDEEEVRCDICKNSFASEAELKRHEYYCKNREEIAQKRKQQKEKEKAVAAQQAVSPAMSASSAGSNLSTGSRPTKDKSCPYCLDVFASMQSRNRHIGRKHPEKKDDQETKNVQYFKVDSPDLPYACQECGKRFASSSSLQTHKKRIHEKILNHVCEKCGKAYPLGSELRKHLRRVHQVTELEAQDMTNF